MGNLRFILQDNITSDSITIVSLILVTLGFVVVLILFCACCNYCILKSAANRDKQDKVFNIGGGVSAIEVVDWQDFRYRPENDISPRRRTTPKFEEYNIRSVSPSPSRNALYGLK